MLRNDVQVHLRVSDAEGNVVPKTKMFLFLVKTEFPSIKINSTIFDSIFIGQLGNSMIVKIIGPCSCGGEDRASTDSKGGWRW